MKRWYVWVGGAISLVLVYSTLRGLRLGEVWQAMRSANYWWLIPGVAVYFLAVWARTWRWHYLLRPVKAISLARLFPVVVIGYMGNNVYPARAGELIRGYVLRRKDEVPFSASLATIVVERIFDGVVMLFFVFVALPLTPLPAHLRQVVILSSLLFFGLLVGFFLLAASPRRTQAIYNRAADRLVPEKWRERTKAVLDRFMEGLRCLRSGRDVAMVFVTSVAIWLTETVKYWFVMHGFGFSVPFYVLMLMAAVVNLATTIPSAPGYVGTFDKPGIEVLEGFGVARGLATGYTLVLHGALWFPITLLGVYYMWRESVSWRDFGAARAAREADAGGAAAEADLG
ncbi:MAG: lysylphosphatidylglycerol synthase transmembrane domain-containing protein [Anaerolineae bacterium]|nr:lysylphosphatidylglycerol synthase transmembrane domain-containing protein [Anaerolineae bacterium]